MNKKEGKGGFIEKNMAHIECFAKLFLSLHHIKKMKRKDVDMSAVIKKRTRDEIIAAFRESIRRKQEWEEQAQEEFKRIREERRLASL